MLTKFETNNEVFMKSLNFVDNRDTKLEIVSQSSPLSQLPTSK